MKTKTFLIIFLTFFGELLIVLALLQFSYTIPRDITYINLFISSFIFLVFMTRLLLPEQYLGKRSQNVFAALGILGASLLIYTILAIWLMVGMNLLLSVSFRTQLLVHAGLLFLLGIGVFFSLTASEKAGSVQSGHDAQRMTLDTIRRIAASVKEKTIQGTIGSLEKERIAKAVDTLRFMSPSDTGESAELEMRLLEAFKRLDSVISLKSQDSQQVIPVISEIESLCRQRKQQYSF